MKKLFTPESLDRFLEEIRLRSLLKRVNYGRSYPLTSHYGGNPYEEAMGNLGGTINAYLVVDGKNVDATIIARPMSDQVRSARGSENGGTTTYKHAERIAASGSRKKEKPPTEGIEFYVDIPGYRILDSTVSEKGVSTSSVYEDDRLNFAEADTNPCVANKDATAELRVLRDDESSLLPPDSVAEKVAEGEEFPAPSRHHEEDTGLADKSGDAYLEARFEEFTDLVAKYGPRIKRFVRKDVGNDEDAEDITQDTLFAAYQSLHLFEGKSEFSTWIFKIAKNKVCNFHRHQRRQMRDLRNVVSIHLEYSKDFEGDAFDLEDTRGESQVDYAIRQEQIDALRLAISKLGNENHRRAVEMSFFGGLKNCEISEILNRREGTIRQWILRALVRLRELLCTSVDEPELQTDFANE